MTTPPHLLSQALKPGEALQLRDASGATLGMIDWTAALRRANRGEIEGVGSPHGTIRYLRVLPAAAMEQRIPDREETYIGRSTVIARTGLGAYRQPLSYGWVWALCELRHTGGI